MRKEDEKTEFKKSVSQLKEGIISLSSILNKHGKANLYFGINDDGIVCPFDIGKKTLQDITNDIRNYLKPLPTELEVNEITLDNQKIIKVSASGYDTPYSAYGKYYIRVNDSDILMTNKQLQTYFENKKENYLKWEEEETNYSLDDVDEDLVIDVIRTANDKGRLNYIYKNLKEAFIKLDLLTKENKIKQAGYYLFGKHKPLTIKLANYPTDSRTEFGEIKEFKGNIIECINYAINYIQNNISFKSEIKGIQRQETPEIPLTAIREIVINSFAHSNYSVKGDFNTIQVFKSLVKIYNPGTIYKNLDPMKFASSEVGSKIRNVLISSVLYIYGYIDAFGTGFDRTFSLCIKENVGYSYKNDEFGFTFIFERKNDYLLSKKYTKEENLLISELKKNKFITIPDLAKALSKSEATIFRHLDKLVEKGFIKRIGSRKTGYWQVL